MKTNVIIFFTKVPFPGKTKTRLQPFFNIFESYELHKSFILDVLEIIKPIDCDIMIFFEPNDQLNLLQNILGNNYECIPQTGQNLGEKMKSALDKTVELGYKKSILIGSDIPLIRKENIINAFEILNTKDIVISPTQDGGYYLIGTKTAVPNIFAIEFSTHSVFEKTCDLIAKNNLTYGVGDTLFDIDEKADILRLREKLQKDKSEHNKETKKTIELIFSSRSDLK